MSQTFEWTYQVAGLQNACIVKICIHDKLNSVLLLLPTIKTVTYFFDFE